MLGNGITTCPIPKLTNGISMEEETTTALCSAIQFKKSETRTMPWTINDILGDDPLLKPVPVESEVNLQDRLPIGASALRAGY